MQSRPLKIGIFASSISVIEHVEKIAADGEDDIQVAYQVLDEAIPIGKKMEKDGVVVIISRRGTAHLLREALRIPVLSLPLTSLGVLKSLKDAASHSRKILLTVFRNKISGLEILEELLDIELTQGVYHDAASLDQVILMARHKGCEIAVGGNITARCAKKHGLRYADIRTSEDELVSTIENAKSVARANREEKAAAQRYRCIIDAASDGIVAVDDTGCITTINRAARNILGIEGDDPAGQPLRRLISHASLRNVLNAGASHPDTLKKINGQLYIFNHVPVMLGQEVIGTVSSFRDVSHVIKAENEVRRSLAKGLVARYTIEDFVYRSKTMQDVIDMARQFAKTDSTILIIGATGTGKEILAQSIHNFSPRSERPFVSVNCAALPDQLLESELFGYEEGAFTGSKKGGKPGLFELAHKGTIFLDEIDATPHNVQIRLLRVLQEREVMRIGADRKIPVDVRVIVAASDELGPTVQDGRFREDLFFRINVLRLFIPPLRDRTEDIDLLIGHFIQRNAEKHSLPRITLPRPYVEKLKHYSWPGNVRQLKNFTERLVLNCNLRCSADALQVLYSELIQYERRPQNSVPASSQPSLKEALSQQKIAGEKSIILKALEASRYNKSTAAKRLGISRTTLWRKMKEAGLE
jgi:PAS domain S-box-containing protein